MTEVLSYAKSFLNLPYIWGGKDPIRGLDCSGLTNLVLRSVGISPGEVNAQAFYDWCLKEGCSQARAAGALAFYGSSPAHITHVAILLNEWQVIEAGGGDATCTTAVAAAQRGAFVKISTIDHRKDLVGMFMPPWPAWCANG